jgi:Tol biopolymer transport system component
MFPRFRRPDSGSARATIVAIAALAIGLAAASAGDAAFPGTNGRIAFLSVRTDGGLELYTVNPDGTGLQQLTRHSPPVWSRPAWSPDGRTIAAVSAIDASVLRVDVRSRRARPLAHALVAGDGIGWSPDGRRFVYSDRGIWIANVDGTRRRRLTKGADHEFAPTWSPNGEYIAFTRSRGGDQIEIMRADGRGVHAIGRGSNPSWSPNSRRLAFQVEPQRAAIATADIRGRSRRTLASNRVCELSAPAWSPRGTIAFTSDCGGNARIEAVDSSGRGRRTLIKTDSGLDTAVSWSPDGKRFTYADGGTLRIGRLDGHSSDVFELPPGGDGQPAWSPDGSRLAAFLTSEPVRPVPGLIRSRVGSPAWSPDGRYLVGIQGDGGETVTIVDLETNAESVIYEDEGIGYVSLEDPAWSPDGRLIAFSVADQGSIAFYDVARGDFVELGKTIVGQDPVWSPDGSRLAYSTSADVQSSGMSVFTASPDGAGVKRIAKNASAPAWSPDGKEIVFVRWLGGNRELYVMRADGTQQRRLTINAGLDIVPDWQPLPITPGV